MNKFKEWAKSINSICTTPVPSIDDAVDAREAADFLDSLATLADEAPTKHAQLKVTSVVMGQTYHANTQPPYTFVTDEYATYLEKKCAVLLAENAELTRSLDINAQKYQDELAAAQQMTSWEQCEFIGNPPEPHASWKSWCESKHYRRVSIMSVYHIADQPKPLLELKDLENLTDYMDYMLTIKSVVTEEEFIAARKALCGE